MGDAPADADAIAIVEGRGSQNPVLDPRETVFDHEPQQQLRILPIGRLLGHPLGADLGGVLCPQFELQLGQQTLEPTWVPAGFHGHPRVNECNRLIASVEELYARLMNTGGERFPYCNCAYSALACFSMGMSGSASFQMLRKCSYSALASPFSLRRTRARAKPRWASAPKGLTPITPG